MIQPNTGSKKTSVEIIEDKFGLTPTSIMTFFTPLVEVEDVIRRDNNIGLRSVNNE